MNGLYSVSSPPRAEERDGPQSAEVSLLGQAELVLKTDGSSILVAPQVADALRQMKVEGLLLGRVAVWRAQPRERERDDDMWRLSSAQLLRLAPGCVRRRPDGTVEQLLRPFILDKQIVPPNAGVFLLADNMSTLLMSEVVRDLLQRYAPGLAFSEVPFAD
jgi:hypothetical protein